MQHRHSHALYLMIAFIALALLTACSATSKPTRMSLDKLVLQKTDLPDSAEWRESDDISIDDPAHPLSNIGSVPGSEVKASYHVFTLVPAASSVMPIMNYAVRYKTEALAAQEWETIVKYLQELPNAKVLPISEESDCTYTTTLTAEEGTTVYWGAIQQNDILLLLVMETLQATEASDALFNQSTRTLERKLGIH